MTKDVCDGCGAESPVTESGGGLLYVSNSWFEITIQDRRDLLRYGHEKQKLLLCRQCVGCPENDRIRPRALHGLLGFLKRFFGRAA